MLNHNSGSVLAIKVQRCIEPISKLPTAGDPIKVSNDSAHGRAVGTHPDHVPDETVLGENRFRRVVRSKRYCGFSTQARNGTCCRRATQATKLCIRPFRPSAAMRFCVAC